MSESCTICAEISDWAGALYPALFPEARFTNRVLWQDDSFVIFPSLGPLTAHHYLLIPRAHVPSFQVLPCDLLRRAESIACSPPVGPSDVERPLLLEHGDDPASNRAGACVDHAHIHLVFTGQPEGIPAPPASFDWRPAGRLSLFPERPGSTPSYLLYGSALDLHWCPAPDPTPCQILRRVVGAALGASRHWDWMADPGIDRVDAMIAARAAVTRTPWRRGFPDVSGPQILGPAGGRWP